MIVSRVNKNKIKTYQGLEMRCVPSPGGGGGGGDGDSGGDGDGDSDGDSGW